MNGAAMPNARIAESLESLDARLAAALARATDDDIRDFLIQAMADDDRLAARFVSRFGEHDARDEAKRLRSDLAAIRKAYARGGFIDYRSSWGFEREYQEALDLHLQPFARKGDAAALFDLLSVAVTHLCGISIDDSDGFTTATFSQLRDYYVAAFSNTPADQVEKRVADVLALAAKLESSPRSQALSWYVVPELLDIPAELFAHDARHASCVIDLCDGRITQLGERAAVEREEREHAAALYPGRSRAGAGWETSSEFEQRRWACRRIEAMDALGRSLDDIVAFAASYFRDERVVVTCADICAGRGAPERAVDVVETALAQGRLQGFCVDRVQLRLLDACDAAGMRARESALLAEMLQGAQLPHGAAAADLLTRYKRCATYDVWETERERLLNGMQNQITLCDCLLSEGLERRLYEIAKAAERFPVERYQDALLRVDPEFVLARYKAGALTWFASAYDRQGYRRESKRLKRLAELPGGKEAAQQVAAELRQQYPRKPALHDELTKAGF